jgi:hypothetical protein
MTIYIPAGATGGIPNAILDVIELRVISTLLQQQNGNQQQDELKQLRNDQAFDLGITPPVVPGN